MIRLFEKGSHAALYAAYRPTYPDKVYSAIIDFMDSECNQGKKSLAVDVACGSGQSTLDLAKRFDRVVGTDISESQIQEAKQNTALKNIDFIVSAGEDLSAFKDGSVDLVTCAQAAHWLDRPKFYTEVRRVLRSGGVLAVYGYGNCYLENKVATDMIGEFYEDTLGPYWSKERRHIDQNYQNIQLPFPGKRIDDIKIEKPMTVKQFRGYLSSWSSYQEFKQVKPENTDLEDLCTKIANVYCPDGHNSPDQLDEVQLTVTWPIFLLLGKNTN